MSTHDLSRSFVVVCSITLVPADIHWWQKDVGCELWYHVEFITFGRMYRRRRGVGGGV